MHVTNILPYDGGKWSCWLLYIFVCVHMCAAYYALEAISVDRWRLKCRNNGTAKHMSSNENKWMHRKRMSMEKKMQQFHMYDAMKFTKITFSCCLLYGTHRCLAPLSCYLPCILEWHLFKLQQIFNKYAYTCRSTPPIVSQMENFVFSTHANHSPSQLHLHF